MMWRIRHQLFGTHFVALRSGWDDYVRPVRFDTTGRPYVKLYAQFIWLRDRDERWEALTFDKDRWLADMAEAPRFKVVA